MMLLLFVLCFIVSDDFILFYFILSFLRNENTKNIGIWLYRHVSAGSIVIEQRRYNNSGVAKAMSLLLSPTSTAYPNKQK